MTSFLPTIKSRDSLVGQPVVCQTRPNGGSTVWTTRTANQSLRETIVDQCHKGNWPAPPLSSVDVGGNMDLKRSYTIYTRTAGVDLSLIKGTTCLVQMIGYTFGLNPAAAASLGVLNTAGTSAVARVLPTNPNASLAQAIGELRRDGLPTLPGSQLRDRVDVARKAGSEYLNVEFGWLPLVNDLQDFARSVRNSRQLIEQYTRDSDRKIRRRYTYPEVLSESVFTGTGQALGAVGTAVNSTVSKTSSTKLWFSGAFRYHVPLADDFMSRLIRFEALSNHLFGTRITPELVWQLAPWSWALDWFTNAGEVIHNISLLGIDGLVMQYGYIMREMRVREVHSGVLIIQDPIGTPHSFALETVTGTETKQRVRANPYGFGIDDVSLSKAQLAILAALGLSRGKRNT